MWVSVVLQPSGERFHTPEGSVDSQRSQSTSDGAGDQADSTSVSVRALASRFEKTDAMTGQVTSAGSQPCSRHGSLKSDAKDRPFGPATVQRTRSKSESFSRKPKSVLKNKKNKSRPRKSVTFADSIAHFANCDEPNSGYESARELSSPRIKTDDRAYYSDDDERLGSHMSYSDNDLDDVEDTGSSNSDESPVGEEEACQLCNKRRNDPGKLFCAKCSFYMGRLKSS